MSGLGRVPKGYKDTHICGECGGFLPLWDLSFGKWCDECVRKNGGLVPAGEIAQARWREAHPIPTRTARKQGASIEDRGPFRSAQPTVVDSTPPPVPEPARDARQWQRAQSLHKAMKCTPEEAYDRLNAADEARRGSDAPLGVS